MTWTAGVRCPPALSHAQTEELVTRNVAGLAKLPASRKRKGKAWSTEEAHRFLESARSDGDSLYAAYVLVLVCGLRKGEVLGLTRDDVDPDAGELVIGRQLQRVGRQLLHRETKTHASDTTLPLPGICVTAVRQRLVDADDARPAAGSALAAHRARLLHELRDADRPAQLQPVLGRPVPQVRGPEDHRA
jgi:integrase